MSRSEVFRRVEDLAEALCAVASPTGEERACADLVERLLRATPMEVERYGESVVARGPRRGRPLVVLVGHIDTVPGGPPLARTADRLVARGASDMKGGLAVMIALAEALDLAALAFDLGLVFYDREEGPWAESGLGPVLDRVDWLREAELAFCLEPTDNAVQVGCMGTLHARVIFHGRAAHSARPWQGENAIHAAGPLLVALGARAPREVDREGFRFREVLSATLARGGTTRNVIPDRFELNLNYRFAPGRDGEEVVAELRALCAPATVEVVELAPSGRVVVQNPHLRRFLAVNGNPVEAKQAWTDVARLSQAGVDAVNLGPGHVAQAHQAGEYLNLAQLHASWEQFARFLQG